MIYFYTFANSKYKNTLCRIRYEALRSHFFDKVIIYTEKDLPQEIRNYCKNKLRGYGYWIWKSYFTKRIMDEIKENDIICYCDAGFHINKKGKKRFNEYIKMIKNFAIGNISFQMNNNLEKVWTKGDIFKHFDAYNLYNTGQLVGGCFIIRKNMLNLAMVNLWKETCFQNRNLLDDSSSIEKNDPQFKENRHDQSIFSIIRKQTQTILLENETEKFISHKKWDSKYPLQARRWKYISKFKLVLYLLKIKKTCKKR